MVRTLRVTAVAAFAASALVVGCGSSVVSKQDYTESVVTTRDRVDFALAQITVGGGAGSVDELVERMETAAERIDAAADDLDEGGSAEGFDDETTELVDSFHQFAAALAATAHDASQPGQEGLLTGTSALQFPAWTKANRVLTSLDEQGITVEPIGSP